MRTTDYDYHLPEAQIAQLPSPERDTSRLLGLDRRLPGQFAHGLFSDFPDRLRAGDLLVMNNSAVIPARLRGTKKGTNGKMEMLLHQEVKTNDWWVMLKPGKRVRPGSQISLKTAPLRPTGTTPLSPTEILATVIEKNAEGHCRLLFSGTSDIQNELQQIGEIPLPPYISRPAEAEFDTHRYQTIYAREKGSVAAPTAGLHFTERVFAKLRDKGVGICHVTLHVGLGTFAPVKADDIEGHVMHSERFSVPEETAAQIAQARADGRRIVAVGTTTVRVLESVAANHNGEIVPGSGQTSIFIYPPYRFRVVNALLTNFHLPKSTLLMLVSAFAAPEATTGREIVLAAYREAIREGYRFFSYGDAMFLE